MSTLEFLSDEEVEGLQQVYAELHETWGGHINWQGHARYCPCWQCVHVYTKQRGWLQRIQYWLPKVQDILDCGDVPDATDVLANIGVLGNAFSVQVIQGEHRIVHTNSYTDNIMARTYLAYAHQNELRKQEEE